jgi:hypothetical protein
MSVQGQGAPLTGLSIWAKQVNAELLNDLGKKALNFAFTGFFDRGAIETRPNPIRQLAEEYGVRYGFDPTTARRFAGDKSLPRGRYYTLCNDAAGLDGGTLVRELRAYYNPSVAGIVQIFDLTDPRDRAKVFGRPDLRSLSHQNIVLVFLPVRHRANPFVKEVHGDRPAALAVTLPLEVRPMQVERTIDLRVPHVADWFTRTITSIDGAFPFRSALDSFEDLLPELLLQQIGGGATSKIAGLWLRQHSIGALVYPSSRTDCGVEVRDGQVIGYRGWNLLDYRHAGRPEMLTLIDLSPYWARSIGIKDEDNVEQAIWFDEVQIGFQPNGPSRGSWQVHGLKPRLEAHWRFNQVAYALDASSDVLRGEAVSLIKAWLGIGISRGEIEATGGTANLLLESLMGVPGRTDTLQELTRQYEQRGGDSTVVQALRELHRACIDNS